MNKFLQQIKNKFILVIIIFAIIFGLAGGFVASLITRSYLLDNYYNIPFFGQINFSNQNGQKELIIRDAKKVVIEQNTKVEEIINTAGNSLVTIFKKNLSQPTAADNQPSNKTVPPNAVSNLNNFYLLDQPLGQGLIITSDGWIVSSWQPEQTNTGNKNTQINPADYVIISKDKKVYVIDKIIKDNSTQFNFLHVTASDLPVIKFADQQDIKNGNLALAVNWLGDSFLTSVVSQRKILNNPVNSTDNFSSGLIMSDNPTIQFRGAPIFNLSGDIIALIDIQMGVKPITQLQGAINSLLKYKGIRRPSLGVNYLDLSRLAGSDNSQVSILDKGAIIYKNSSGAAVIKGSAAEKAGLKEDDIIISVNNFEINQDNNLTDIIQSYSAGDKIRISYNRGGVEQEVEVILGQVK